MWYEGVVNDMSREAHDLRQGIKCLGKTRKMFSAAVRYSRHKNGTKCTVQYRARRLAAVQYPRAILANVKSKRGVYSFANQMN